MVEDDVSAVYGKESVLKTFAGSSSSEANKVSSSLTSNGKHSGKDDSSTTPRGGCPLYLDIDSRRRVLSAEDSCRMGVPKISSSSSSSSSLFLRPSFFFFWLLKTWLVTSSSTRSRNGIDLSSSSSSSFSDLLFGSVNVVVPLLPEEEEEGDVEGLVHKDITVLGVELLLLQSVVPKDDDEEEAVGEEEGEEEKAF